MLKPLSGVLRGVACALALAAMAGPAFAKTYVFKRTGRETPIVMPDNWAVQTIPRGIQIRSNDEEVYMWVEAVTDGSLEEAMDEYMDYFKKEGVTFTGAPTQSKSSIAGTPVLFIDFPATYKGKPNLVRMLVSDAKAGEAKGMLVGYWASPEGDKKYEQPVGRIVEDLLRP